MSTAIRTKPKLWEKVKKKYMNSDKAGKPGEWNARKAQLAVKEYKKKGGDYIGKKTKKNSLVKWTKEDWGRDYPGGRYLPLKAREALTDDEYNRTSMVKIKGTKQGKQYVRQLPDIAKKTAKYRK